MIWRELWWRVLAVVYRKHLVSRWVANTAWFDRRLDDVHSPHFTQYPWGRYNSGIVNQTCLCSRCVDDAFGHVFEWVQIR